MYDQFLPSEYEQILFKQYHYCHQSLRSVAAYTNELLWAHNDLVHFSSPEVLRYTTDLHEPIWSQVDVRNISNFPDAITLATRYENQFIWSSRFSFKKLSPKMNQHTPLFSPNTKTTRSSYKPSPDPVNYPTNSLLPTLNPILIQAYKWKMFLK